MSGPAAGSYEPGLASIYKRTTVRSAAGEIGGSAGTVKYRAIRFVPLSSYETSQHEAVVATGLTRIRMRRDSFTESITPEYFIEYRGKTFGILGYNNIQYGLDEVEFNAQQEQPA